MDFLATTLYIAIMIALITIALAIPFWIIIATGRTITRLNRRANRKH